MIVTKIEKNKLYTLEKLNNYMPAKNLDMNVLRTLVTGMELGSFAKAADRVGRSPSAVSLQLRKLEEQVGVPLFHKKGRGLALSETGEVFIGFARRLLDLNDEALAAVRDLAISGWVRLGLPQDFAESWFPDALAHFTRLHPDVRVEARVDRNAVLLDDLQRGELDLVLAWDQTERPPHSIKIASVPLVWIGPKTGFTHDPTEPVPVIGFPPPCIFRHAAASALDGAGIPWRMTFSSPGLSGIWAAVSAGLGVSVRTAYGIPDMLRVLDGASSRLPPLPALNLSMHLAESPAPPAVERLASILRERLTMALDAKLRSPNADASRSAEHF